MSLRGKEFTWSQGAGQSTNGSVDAAILGAPGASNYLHIERAVVTVYKAAVGNNGIVALEDGAGGTKVWRADSDVVGQFELNFGDRGYRLSANTTLNLTVEGAATSQAWANCIAIAHVAPDGY